MNDDLIISYCFFTPKQLHQMRFWDKYNTHDRYWYNIPSMICINSIVYPNAKIKIYISSNIHNHRLYPLLQNINDVYDNVEIITLDYDYVNTEPTIWRYKPLFDKEANIVLCRDIDSIPTLDEIYATYHFINNENYKIHTIRSHTNHSTKSTIILAGLCGFRTDIDFIKNISFDDYYSSTSNKNWGFDQQGLINLFTKDSSFTEKYFLDSPISSKEHIVGNPIIKCISKRVYDNIEIYNDIIPYINSQISWAGEPIKFTGKELNTFLNIDNCNILKMKNIINDNNILKQFYCE